jgi:hypothetical protein
MFGGWLKLIFIEILSEDQSFLHQYFEDADPYTVSAISIIVQQK